AKLKAELIQKSSQYSNSHPEVRGLKRKINGLEQAIAKTPQTPQTTQDIEPGLEELEKQRENVDKNLEEANRKMMAARLGERLERDHQSEALQVMKQPTLPQKPIRPNRLKLFALAFFLAGAAGMGTVFAAESLDQTIRSTRQLAGLIDRHLIVAI